MGRAVRDKPRAARRGRGGRRASTGVQVLEALPIRNAFLRRLFNWMLGLAVLAAITVGIFAMQLPQMAWRATGEAIGEAGFTVRNVDVRGRARMDREQVINIAMDQPSRAMPLVDLDEIRERLLGLNWVAEARVSRHLPDTLVLDITERRPIAVWQYQQRLSLIDRTGTVIAPVEVTAMPDLPIVIGPGANRHVAQFQTMIEQVPSLRPMVSGATWIGNRRWDLRFHSGETLALPEGDMAAMGALKDFARRDSEHRLLGQGFVRFDMRVPGRIVVRLVGEPGKRGAGGTGASLGADEI